MGTSCIPGRRNPRWDHSGRCGPDLECPAEAGRPLRWRPAQRPRSRRKGPLQANRKKESRISRGHNKKRSHNGNLHSSAGTARSLCGRLVPHGHGRRFHPVLFAGSPRDHPAGDLSRASRDPQNPAGSRVGAPGGFRLRGGDPGLRRSGGDLDQRNHRPKLSGAVPPGICPFHRNLAGRPSGGWALRSVPRGGLFWGIDVPRRPGSLEGCLGPAGRAAARPGVSPAGHPMDHPPFGGIWGPVHSPNPVPPVAETGRGQKNSLESARFLSRFLMEETGGRSLCEKVPAVQLLKL
jgi:hypothetical protein